MNLLQAEIDMEARAEAREIALRAIRIGSGSKAEMRGVYLAYARKPISCYCRDFDGGLGCNSLGEHHPNCVIDRLWHGKKIFNEALDYATACVGGPSWGCL